MKHYIVWFLSIIWIIYYMIFSYQQKSLFQDDYSHVKQELLSQKTEISNKNDISDKPYKVSNNTIQESSSTKILKKANLDVDFYPQSPFGKWWPIFEDTCEEASLLLALNYIKGDYMNRIQFRDELLKIVDWQNKNFWYFKDTNVAQTAEILDRYYNFKNYNIVDNPSIDDIKIEISNGNIVIAPFYGINLNPNYWGNGPDYHFMVIKGYTENSFITHDVGTNKWENYMYNQNTLYNRIHDYHPIDIELGEKKIIVLKK